MSGANLDLLPADDLRLNVSRADVEEEAGKQLSPRDQVQLEHRSDSTASILALAYSLSRR